MKYIISALLAISLLASSGCKNQHVVVKDPYPDLNLDFVRANCNPEERYQFPVFGTFAMPARAKNCAGVSDLWIVAWPGENTELEQSIAKVLTILYVRSENEQKDPDIQSTFLRNSSAEDNSIHAAFYELTEVPAKSPESSPQE